MFLGLLIRTEPTKEANAVLLSPNQSQMSTSTQRTSKKEIRIMTEMVRSTQIHNPYRIISYFIVSKKQFSGHGC